MAYSDRMKRNLINTINMLPFNEENFEFLKKELIDSIFPKSIAEQVEDKMSGIDRNFKEQELDEDFNAMSDYYEDNPEW